jgi:nitrite reductase/ring-hydroxylating ferredoxin subunit
MPGSVESARIMEIDISDRVALAPGAMQRIEEGDEEIVVARVGDEFYAVGAICSHSFGYLDDGDLEGYELICPLHEGSFDVRTGEAIGLPAVDPIRSYCIRRQGNSLLLDLDAQNDV